MSKIDAIRDGIKFDSGRRGGLVYHIPCQVCGQTYDSLQYTGNRIYICPICRSIRKKKCEAFIDELALSMPEAETKEEKRYRKAVEAIEKQCGSLKGYEKAVELCRKAMFKYGSVPEAILAIQLIKDGFRIIPQQRIGRYHVDFALPNEKLLVEVDGSIYHTNTEKEMAREGSINYAIGLDWHFVHVPAEAITKDVRKVSKFIRKKGTQGTTV